MMDEVGRAGKNRAVTGGGLGRDSENGGSQVGRGFFVVVALGGDSLASLLLLRDGIMIVLWKTGQRLEGGGG